MNTSSHLPIVATVDIIIPRLVDTEIEIALIKRRKAPFAGLWALPGGKLESSDSSLDTAATREAFEETGVRLLESTLRQLHTFGDARRDPRGYVVSVVYLAPLQGVETKLIAGDDAGEAAWFSLHTLPPLAFDHARILQQESESIIPLASAMSAVLPLTTYLAG